MPAFYNLAQSYTWQRQSMSKSVIISTQHPSIPGHFPGQPVVPGVVILEQVRLQLASLYPDLCVSGVKKLKFLRLLQPDCAFYVQFSEPKHNGIRFSCLTHDDEVLAQGHLDLSPIDSPSQATGQQRTGAPQTVERP